MDSEKNYDQILKNTLLEGVHDKGIFKAVFLAGGPGSGKDYVLNNTLDGHGLVEINSDKALEYLMDKEDLDKRMPDNEEAQRNEARKRAKNVTELRQRLALHGRNGLIINGTGDDPEKYKKIKKTLEKMGYETKCVMVNTDDDVSQKRNIERGQRGGRTVPENIRKQKWDAVQAARPELAKMFRDNYVEFDNSFDARNIDQATKEQKDEELQAIYKDVAKFVNSKPKNNQSKEWVANEMSRKDTAPISKKAEPHPNSSAADKARELGLEYYGFGRYGKDGKVTHRSVHDSLVQVTDKKPLTPRVPVSGSSGSNVGMKTAHKEKLTNIKASSKLPKDVKKENFNSEFQSFLNENVPKEKHITDRNGNIRVFVLRNSAAKEAHVKNGEVHKHPKGYIVKLREDKTNNSNNVGKVDEAFEEFLHEAVTVTITGDTAEEVNNMFKLLKNEGEEVDEQIDYGTTFSNNGAYNALTLGKRIVKEETQFNPTLRKNVKTKGDLNEISSPTNNAIEAVYGQNFSTPDAKQLGKVGTNFRPKGKPALDKPYSESHNGSGSATRTKITFNQIKENWRKKVEESIDKGIEPGISMAGAGESPARDMGEKLSKRGKATQVMPVKEMTGDETGASIGDQKEDELKKKGISLLSFKKKNYV
jgi:hypothetical protein